METGENKPEAVDSRAERILALIKDAKLTDEELDSLAAEISKLVKGRKEDPASADATKPAVSEAAETPAAQPEKEEERNQFGLPHSWSRQTSLRGLESIRESLQRAGSVDVRVISAAL